MTWPFVGRRAELARGRRALTDPTTTAFVLTGAAGVGKTQLARELLRIAAGAGSPTRWIAATRSAATIPFGALAHLLTEPDGGALTRFELLRVARQRILTNAGTGRLVLGVDDIHLLDDASAALVHQLAASQACLVVATLRDREPVPDAVGALLRAGTTERAALDTLSRDDTDALVAQALGGDVALATRRELWRLSGGNALVLRELVRGALAAGALVERDGLWLHRGDLGRSQGLATLVASRLHAVAPAARDALEIVALAEPVGVALLEDLSGVDAVAALEAAGLLSVTESGLRTECRLTHPAYTEALLAGLTPGRRRRLCRRIAATVDATGARRRDDVLRLAVLRLAGGAPADPELLVRAARRAQERFDHRLTERLARAAAGAGHTEGWLVLGEALVAQRRADEALEALEAADRQAAERNSRVRARLARATTRLLHAGDREQALALLDSAALEAGDDPDSRAALAAARALVLSFLGDYAGCMAVADDLLARQTTSRHARVETLTVSTFVQAFSGQAERALVDAERGLGLLDELGDPLPFAGAKLELNAVLALLSLGRLVEADRRAEAGYRNAAEAGALDLVGVWGVILGLVRIVRGQPRNAQRVLAEAGAALDTADPLDMRRTAAALRAQAAALVGARDDADRWLAAHDAFDGGSPDRFSVLRTRAGAWAAARGGALDEAVGRAEDAARAARAAGHTTWQAFALHDMVRFGRPERAAGNLRALAGEADGELFPAFAAHAEAAATADAAALDAASERFARLGAVLLAAEAAAGAAGAHRRAGAKDAAARAAGRAALLAGGCEGARTPALGSAASMLTAREAEVATRAAQGLTSRAIAEALTLSVRTVDNHLARVYDKLGVADRRALRSLIAPDGGTVDPRSPGVPP